MNAKTLVALFCFDGLFIVAALIEYHKGASSEEIGLTLGLPVLAGIVYLSRATKVPFLAPEKPLSILSSEDRSSGIIRSDLPETSLPLISGHVGSAALIEDEGSNPAVPLLWACAGLVCLALLMEIVVDFVYAKSGSFRSDELIRILWHVFVVVYLVVWIHRSILFLKSREVMPVQTVDATPLCSIDLARRFKRTDPLGGSSLLLKQDAFSLLLCSRMILSSWNSWTWDALQVLHRPIETADLTGH